MNAFFVAQNVEIVLLQLLLKLINQVFLITYCIKNESFAILICCTFDKHCKVSMRADKYTVLSWQLKLLKN